MIPNINPKQLQKAMQRMGIRQQQIDATEVIIRTPDKDIIITSPDVAKVNMMGQETFQISGNITESEKSVEISEEDVKIVREQTGKDDEAARTALKESKGDIAAAIMKLQ